MAHDSKCYDLAEAFLDDADAQHINTEANRNQLAQEIQDAIENFITHAKDNYDGPDVPGWEGGFAPNH